MKIKLKAESRLGESERLGLARLSAEAFPPDGEDTQWAQSDWHVLVWEGDEIVSHVEIVERTASVGGRPVRLGGIGGEPVIPSGGEFKVRFRATRAHRSRCTRIASSSRTRTRRTMPRRSRSPAVVRSSCSPRPFDTVACTPSICRCIPARA